VRKPRKRRGRTPPPFFYKHLPQKNDRCRRNVGIHFSKKYKKPNWKLQGHTNNSSTLYFCTGRSLIRRPVILDVL
jgi:hypothetical protein